MQKAKSQLGSRLRARRKAAGLTGTELGLLLGISQATVSKLETGQTRRLDEDLIRSWAEHTVDATGAGDQFAAGFLYGLATGQPLATCGRMGCVAATEVIGHFGARPETSLADLFRAEGLI